MANMGLAGPHQNGKQEVNHLPANRQMATSGPRLMVGQKLFTQKKYPKAFLENTIYKQIDGDALIRSSIKSKTLQKMKPTEFIQRPITSWDQLSIYV